MNRWSFILGILLILGNSARGQDNNIQFDRLNLEQGLSQGTVYSILQDRTGFMWFGTQDGLNKFDGYTFTTYRVNQGDPTSLSDNYTQELYEDQKGNIWVGTLSGGLNRFDRDSETFAVFRHQAENDHSISSDKVVAILEDHNGNLWAGTPDGLNKLLSDNHSFKRYSHSPRDASGLSHSSIQTLFVDSQNNLWVGTENGLNLYLPEKDTFRRYMLSEEQSSANFVTVIREDYQGNLLVGTQEGLFTLSNVEGNSKFDLISFPQIEENLVSALLVDPDGTHWIGYDREGMIRWNEAQDQIFHIKYDPARPKSLSNNLVYDFYFDKFSNLWAGTLNGINKTNISHFKFDLYQNVQGILGHTSNSIFGIQKDPSGAIWTATRQGLFYLNRADNTLEHFDNTKASRPTLKNRAFRSLYQDDSGIVWLGSEEGDLEALDPVNRRLAIYLLNPEVSNNTIYKIYEHRPGTLWLGTHSGLYRFDKQSGSITYYDLEKILGKTINSNEIRAIIADSKSNLWLGTLGAGLFYFDLESETLTQFEHDPKDPFSISGNIAPSLFIDAQDTLWVGTASGLNKFHLTESKFYRFNESDGLPNDVVYGILSEGDQLWLSTNQGISRFNKKTRSFRNYHVSDGLQGSEFNAGAYHQGSDGELLFGGIDGYNGFYPASIKDNQLIPTVVLTGFKVFNEDRPLSKSLEATETITLSYRDSFFSFEFAGLHLVAPEKNQYTYMMEGFDREWIKSDRRYASYTNLDPGSYTFRVKASNNDGIWNDEGLALKVNITPPFWQTLWFYISALLLVSVIIYAFYRFRIAQVRKEEKLKTEFNKKLAEVEMTALRAQMNPHFLFNCLNSINRYIVKSDPETASGYLTKFSRLIRLILQNSKSSTVPLESELDALKLYIEMEEMRFDNQFAYKIQVDKNIESHLMAVPPMILQPYVENAIWHGLMHKPGKGMVELDISFSNGVLHFVIEDDGIGRDKSREYNSRNRTRKKSMGMRITEDRINMINKLYNSNTSVKIVDLKNPAGEAAGTKVELDIPI